MPGSPSRDVPCWLPMLDPSSLQIREVGALENANVADRLGRKVRRLPIIISFSLMRCLLSLPKVISCPSKCIIWPELDAILMEREENTNPGAGGGREKASLLQLKRMSERWYSPRILSNMDLVQQVWSSTEPEGARSVWQVCTSFRKKRRLKSSPHSSAPVILHYGRAWTAAED